MTQRLRSGVAVPRHKPPALRGGVILLGLLAAAGCSAPEIRRIDEKYAAISRGLVDVVDAADRAFGERRVEDREKIVQLKLGPAVAFRENNDTRLTMPVSLRLPLPAFERRANIFLRVDSIADSGGNAQEVVSSLGDNKTFSATLISRIADLFDLGLRVDVLWVDGPRTGLRPFLRWEKRVDPNRLLIEQQTYWRTAMGFGEKTIFQFDHILNDVAFLRLVSSIENNQYYPGRSYEHAVIYRRSLPSWNLALTAELGTRHNTYDGNQKTNTPGAGNDPDEGYLQFGVTGRVLRPWIEYEVKPAAFIPWRIRDKPEYGITFMLRVVYESFFNGPPEQAPAAPPEVITEPP